jgi:hypothetical protein
MDGEGVLAGSTLDSALYWRQIYSEMLEMEERYSPASICSWIRNRR